MTLLFLPSVLVTFLPPPLPPPHSLKKSKNVRLDIAEVCSLIQQVSMEQLWYVLALRKGYRSEDGSLTLKLMILGRGQTLNKLLHFFKQGVWWGLTYAFSQKIILTAVWGLVGGQSKSGWEHELPRKINFISPHLKILLLVSNSFFFPISKSCRYDINPYIIPAQKHSKWLKDLDARAKTIKLFRREQGGKLWHQIWWQSLGHETKSNKSKNR